MSTHTKIEWTDRTWNPTRGCSFAKGSETGGCLNCYAARRALQMAGKGGAYEGLVRLTPNGPRWTGRVVLVEERLEDPLRWKQPARVFVDSMSDLFHESLPFKTIARIVRVMLDAPWHTYQVLTKRAARLREFSEWYAMQYLDKLPAHIWFGVSVENQPTADERIAELLRALLTGVRWVSYEPALGPVDFTKWLIPQYWASISGTASAETERAIADVARAAARKYQRTDFLDWLVIGGESGPCARPFDLAWARSAIAQCRAAGVACFVKQLGARPQVEDGKHGQYRLMRDLVLKDRKGADMSEWPEDLRVREYPR